MEPNQAYTDKLEKAKKRVSAIKGFFKHLRIFLMVSIIIAVLYIVNAWPVIILDVEPVITVREALSENVLSWINLNIWINLGLWAVILLIHGLIVFNFRFPFIKEWEDRQIQKYLNEE